MLAMIFNSADTCPLQAVAVDNSNTLKRAALMNVSQYRGRTRLEMVNTGANALTKLRLTGTAVKGGAHQTIADSTATPSDFSVSTDIKPSNSVSPGTLASGASGWITIQVDGFAEIGIEMASSGGTSVSLSAGR